jgi:hypothetical protein
MEILLQLFLLVVGAWTVGGWCQDMADRLAKCANDWSVERAHCLVGQAILDHEWARTGNPLRAFEFALFIMTGQRVKFLECGNERTGEAA